MDLHENDVGNESNASNENELILEDNAAHDADTEEEDIDFYDEHGLNFNVRSSHSV